MVLPARVTLPIPSGRIALIGHAHEGRADRSNVPAGERKKGGRMPEPPMVFRGEFEDLCEEWMEPLSSRRTSDAQRDLFDERFT